MDHYLIVKNSTEIELERFEEERFQKAHKYFEPGRILYESVDIQDEKFKDFETIIWERFFNYHSKSSAKVIVPFTPEDIKQMKENAEYVKEEKIKAIYERIQQDKMAHYEAVQKKLNSEENKEKLENHRQMVAEMDKLIPPKTDEYEAISKWREMGFPLPPPTIITRLKNDYKKSWNEFIQICNNV